MMAGRDTWFDPVRVSSLYEACVLAKEHGATCYSRFLTKGIDGKGALFSVSFFRSRPKGVNENIAEVATWCPSYMGIYKRLERPFAACFIRNTPTAEGFQAIEDIAI